MTKLNREDAAREHLAKAAAALANADEALARAMLEVAANRAYYCCFHAARAALAVLGVQLRTHRGVSEKLNSELVAPGKLEAEYLSLFGTVQRRREIADYDVEETITSEQARQSVEHARRFFERLQRFAKDAGLS